MTSNLTADVVVIGFGKGGKVTAAALGRAGRRVILIERSDQMYGGTCPNVGCVPTKQLVHHSSKRRPDDSAEEWFERSIAEVQALTSTFRAGNYNALNEAENITVLTGTASFVDEHTVAVGDVRIVAETILINTGSESVIPNIPGLRESPRTVTNVDLIHTAHLPGRLAVIGGGYQGIEFASIYRRFGTQVTVLESSDRILGREDDDVAAVAADILTGEGVEIVAGAEVLEIRDEDTVVYRKGGREHTLKVDAILAATGRAPASAELKLENAGVRTTAGGAVEVDSYLRTSQPHIFALGDVNGGPQFTYISLDDSRIVVDQLLGSGKRSTADRVAVPQTLFMSPPLATVGLTEKAAREAGYRVRIGMENVADIVAMPRAYIVEETRGAMKFVIDAETDEILGAALLSVDAQELINVVTLAMRHRITATELRDSIYTHPSSTEAFNEVLATIVR
ncbi:FAD-dependent oxidoreductase [Kribbella sp. CA-245084]|uniref:FAD-dependent oxidoreductase n=1 Tax=Kribbella sp. CA-245084 TaxID=3239940 RepID=UPI003D8FD6D6